MFLSVEAIVAVVTLVVTCPPAFFAMWKLYNRRRHRKILQSEFARGLCSLETYANRMVETDAFKCDEFPSAPQHTSPRYFTQSPQQVYVEHRIELRVMSFSNGPFGYP
jgi:hypothetical protein